MDTMDALEPYLDRLRALPFVRQARVTPRKGARSVDPADATLELRTIEGKTLLVVEHRRSHLSTAAADHLLQIHTERPNLLLLCPFVGRELAERFGRAGLSFVDLAGNCHVQLGERFLAHVEGRRAEEKPHAERALRAQSYRVLFAMLAKPELTAATARALAQAAGGISPQTAIDTRARFMERGILLETSRGAAWAPRGWRDALDIFVSGFSSTLAPQLIVGRFRAAERDPEALEATMQARLAALDDLEWRWGGGAACARLTGHFRGDQTILYVKEAHPSLAKQLGLRPDRAGPVRLITAPGPIAFESPAEHCVHPLLAYVDLLGEGDERARDAAGELYRRYLAPLERAPR